MRIYARFSLIVVKRDRIIQSSMVDLLSFVSVSAVLIQIRLMIDGFHVIRAVLGFLKYFFYPNLSVICVSGSLKHSQQHTKLDRSTVQ